MNKLFILSLLVPLSVSAADISATSSYDYDRATSPFLSQANATIGLKADFGKLGAIDGGLLQDKITTGLVTTGRGYGVGYGNSLPIGKVTLVGHVEFQQVDFRNAVFGNTNDVVGTFSGKSLTWNYSVEVDFPITKTFSGFVGYTDIKSNARGPAPNTDFVTGIVGPSASQGDRYILGTDIALTDKISLRVGYARLVTGERTFNGATTGLSYKF